MYVYGCRLSLVRLCDSEFGTTPADNITIGITCAAFCFHMAHISLIYYYYYPRENEDQAYENEGKFIVVLYSVSFVAVATIMPLTFDLPS